MCCPFIATLVIGVSNKAYSDTCGCLWKELQVTHLHKHLQGHTSDQEYIWLCNGYKVFGSWLLFIFCFMGSH